MLISFAYPSFSYRSLAVEWSRYGMRFNAIAPGPIKTEVLIIGIVSQPLIGEKLYNAGV